MKRLNAIGLFFLIGLVCGCSANLAKVVFDSPQQIKTVKNIAVFPFVSNRSETGRIIAEALAANLKESRFAIIEQIRLQNLLAQHRLKLIEVSEKPQSSVGKLKGVDAIITGSASVRAFRGYIDHVAEASARMIDVASGDILLEVTFSSGKAGRLKGTIPADQVGKELAEKISSY